MLQAFNLAVFFIFLTLFNAASATQVCGALASSDIKNANDCYITGEYPKAIEFANKALEKNKNNNRAYALMAMAYMRSDQHEQAVLNFQRAINLGANTYDVYALYGMSLDALGRTNDAIKWYKQSLIIVPGLADVTGNLATALVKTGKKDEAVQLLEKYDAAQIAKGKGPRFKGQIMVIKEGTGTFETPPTELSNDVSQRLAALKDLYENGLISQDDYDDKKSEILKGVSSPLADRPLEPSKGANDQSGPGDAAITKKSTDTGPDHFYNLGTQALRKGDYKSTVSFWLQASNAGLSIAQYSLGQAYFDGKITQKNYKDASIWFEKVSDIKNSNLEQVANAQYFLGLIYETGGFGIEKNMEKSLNLYTLSAKKNVSAQNRLGEIYLGGLGVSKNYQEAFKYFSMAAKNYNSSAQLNLGLLYAYGDGVKKDQANGFFWLELASRSSDPKVKLLASQKLFQVAKFISSKDLADGKKLIAECKTIKLVNCGR